MALIPCPECQKQISYDFSDILSDINSEQRTPVSFVRQISGMCNIPISEAVAN